MRYKVGLLFCIFACHLCAEEDAETMVQSSATEQKAMLLLNGMYEAVSWNDGETLHKPPTIKGRWVFIDGKIMCIIHNAIDPENEISSIGWGFGKVEKNRFVYGYPEFRTVKGKSSASVVIPGAPFNGLREYKIEFKDDRMIMRSATGKQIWEINPEGMVYTDQEWGPAKVFAQRIWKRITDH